jgi:hypothetical protein
MRRRVWVVLAVAMIFGLGGCSGGDSDSDSLPDLRTQARDAAAKLIPKLATEVGGTVGDGSGRYNESGGGLSAITFSYSAGGTITFDKPGPYTPAIEKALRDLGYETKTVTSNSGDQSSVSAKKDGLSILVGEKPDFAPDEVFVSVDTPYVKVSKDEVKDYQAKVAKEPLDLK